MRVERLIYFEIFESPHSSKSLNISPSEKECVRCVRILVALKLRDTFLVACYEIILLKIFLPLAERLH